MSDDNNNGGWAGIFVCGLLFLGLIGSCTNNSGSTSSSGTTYTSSGGSSYDSDSFRNADPKVQEDVMIYQMLRNSGYSESESKRAVINTMD